MRPGTPRPLSVFTSRDPAMLTTVIALLIAIGKRPSALQANRVGFRPAFAAPSLGKISIHVPSGASILTPSRRQETPW
jgi:hypothetical protein